VGLLWVYCGFTVGLLFYLTALKSGFLSKFLLWSTKMDYFLSKNTIFLAQNSEVFLFYAVVLGFYLLFGMIPYFIARSRNHRQAIPILLCALFFPFAGWIIALIWAFVSGENQGGRRRSVGLSRARRRRRTAP
jgi:hypothetical protein